MVSFGMNVVYSTTLPVWVALWTPNILFLAGGMYFFHLTMIERRLNIAGTLRRLKRRRSLRKGKQS